MSKHPGLTEHCFRSGRSNHQIQLFLFQKEKKGCMPVLLLHGASARHETFTIPKSQCLMDYLWDQDFEPWLLDWRGSGKVVDATLQNDPQGKEFAYFDFDDAADYDVPAALEKIHKEKKRTEGNAPKKIGVVGHCMGAGRPGCLDMGTLHDLLHSRC